MSFAKGIPWFLVVVLVCFSWAVYAEDESPPLPAHGIEGYGGIFSTYSAYLPNPAQEGRIWGLPSVEDTYVHLGNGRHLHALTVTETFRDRIEFGYGWNRMWLGDLDDDVYYATEMDLRDDYVDLHNFNVRMALLKEGEFDCPMLPALTLGVHYKYNETYSSINRDLNGTLEAIGVEDNDGVDFTLYASKMFADLPRPLLLNAGIRSTEAAHIGLLGFTDDRDIVFEGNAVLFVTDKFLLASEYRQKPENYSPIPGLVEAEDDWWTLCCCYIVNNHLTVSGGYGHFGDVLNHAANKSWGVRAKYEF
jgi:hypothetical protein